MPPRSERVAAMVRQELARDPSIGNAELLKKARGIDPGVRRLSPRQFHATFRLPALRGMQSAAAAKPAPAQSAKPAPAPAAKPVAAPPPSAAAAPAQTPAPAAAPTAAPEPPAHKPASTAVSRPGAAQREVVRQVLQTVAREALAAEDRASFVRLLDSLDQRAAMIMGLFHKE
jgi:outer membrane biosynthesis protein TonB